MHCFWPVPLSVSQVACKDIMWSLMLPHVCLIFKGYTLLCTYAFQPAIVSGRRKKGRSEKQVDATLNGWNRWLPCQFNIISLTTANMWRIQPMMPDTAQKLQEMVRDTMAAAISLVCLHQRLSPGVNFFQFGHHKHNHHSRWLSLTPSLSLHPFIHSSLCLWPLCFQFWSHATQCWK